MEHSESAATSASSLTPNKKMIRHFINKVFGGSQLTAPADQLAFERARSRLKKTMNRHCKEIEDQFGALVVDMQRSGETPRKVKRRKK